MTDKIEVFTFEKLMDFDNLTHFISTRHGGVSQGSYSSMNLGLSTNDNAENVLFNRKILSNRVNVNLEKWIFANITHDDKVQIIEKNESNSDVKKGIDALVTNVENKCLAILVADCVPLLFYDPIQKVIGIAHAGWRGTTKKIATIVIEMMVNKFYCNPENIFVGIGPSIGSCCYILTDEAYLSFQKFSDKEDYISTRNKKSYLNLWKANFNQLIQSGIRPNHIEIAEICTSCNNTLYYSHRYQKGSAGRFGAGIMLKNR